ncbi:hypothetical protein MNB_SUP05-SYMBIONT-5-33 [hydrothermal vent metagenome]|uniref:Uncharacterized protein n=1 Tax=hydrothermal vent metagenome TaxID=652676 RepID=A0A1W1E1E6_9ZZZZ
MVFDCFYGKIMNGCGVSTSIALLIVLKGQCFLYFFILRMFWRN